jgi:hypothetical protein
MDAARGEHVCGRFECRRRDRGRCHVRSIFGLLPCAGYGRTHADAAATTGMPTLCARQSVGVQAMQEHDSGRRPGQAGPGCLWVWSPDCYMPPLRPGRGGARISVLPARLAETPMHSRMPDKCERMPLRYPRDRVQALCTARRTLPARQEVAQVLRASMLEAQRGTGVHCETGVHYGKSDLQERRIQAQRVQVPMDIPTQGRTNHPRLLDVRLRYARRN